MPTTDAQKFAAVFRAAAVGVMQPYTPPPGFSGMWGPYDGKSYDRAKEMSCAFGAIADLFSNIAKAETINAE